MEMQPQELDQAKLTSQEDMTPNQAELALISDMNKLTKAIEETKEQVASESQAVTFEWPSNEDNEVKVKHYHVDQCSNDEDDPIQFYFDLTEQSVTDTSITLPSNNTKDK